MPSHRGHKYFEKPLLGKTFPEVHKALDAPAKFLGKKHRILFHTPFEAALISTIICGNPLPGLLHIALDEGCTKDKTFKKILELLAKKK